MTAKLNAPANMTEAEILARLDELELGAPRLYLEGGYEGATPEQKARLEESGRARYRWELENVASAPERDELNDELRKRRRAKDEGFLAAASHLAAFPKKPGDA